MKEEIIMSKLGAHFGKESMLVSDFCGGMYHAHTAAELRI